jgi:hypothetical protein
MPSCRNFRILAALLLLVARPAFADEDDDTAESSPRRSVTSDGPGVLARGGFLGGATLGRDDSIVPVQVMPYLLFDPHFVFADVRLFVSTEGRVGGNLGGGYRFLDEQRGAWYGINGWIDVDQTSGEVFPQLGLGLEAAWSILEGRSNFYLPVGTRDQVLETSALNTRYSGHNILFDQHTITGQSLAGVDGEIGISLPIEALDRALILRGFVGGYHFANDNGDPIDGVRARSEVVISSSVITQLEYTSDDEYGQNLIVGVSIEGPWGEDHPGVEWRRPTPSPFRFVQRNYNVILDRTESTANDLMAINPATSQPYFVQHVNTNAASGGNGTIESPFTTYAPATGQTADIILVHAGSELHESLVVQDHTRVLGDTGRHTFRAVGWGDVALPTVAAGDTPLISDLHGDAVSLGTGSELSGFQLDNITGTGVRGLNVTDLVLSDLTFTNIHGDAVALSGLSDGNVTLTNLSLDGVSGRGLAFMGLEGQLIASELTLNNIDGPAILLDGGSGDAYFVGNTVITGDHSRIDVRNTSGHVEFAGLEITGQATPPLVSLTNLDGDLAITSLKLKNTNGAGLVASDVASLAITKGTIATTNGTALSLSDTEVAATLSSVDVDGGNIGVRLINVTGGLVINGGTIENTGVAVDLNDVESVQLTTLKLTDNTLGIQSRSADYLKLDRLTITGTAGYALDSLDDTLLSVQGSTFSDNGTLDAGTILVQAGTAELFRSEFTGNTITDDRGTALQFLTTTSGTGASLSTTVTGNTIVASRGDQGGIKMNWNGPAELTLSGNTFQFSGTSMTGIDLAMPSTTESLTATINGNTFTLGGAHNVAVNVAAAGTSELSVTANTITHNGTGGVGLKFDFGDATELWVSTNHVTDAAGGATGMLFEHVATLSKLQIENNQLDLTSSSSSVDRGILFQSIADDVELFGSYDNLINSATDAFYMPSADTIGGFYVNGELVP